MSNHDTPSPASTETRFLLRGVGRLTAAEVEWWFTRVRRLGAMTALSCRHLVSPPECLGGGEGTTLSRGRWRFARVPFPNLLACDPPGAVRGRDTRSPTQGPGPPPA